MVWEEEIKHFSQELTVGGYSKKTIEMYSFYLKDFFRFTKKEPGEIERADIIAYLSEKQSSDMSGTSLALLYSALKHFFHSFMQRRIMEDIKRPKKGNTSPWFLQEKRLKNSLILRKGKGTA